MKNFLIVACLVAAGYVGYQRSVGPAPGEASTTGQGSGESRLPVLQMSPEASEGLAQMTASRVVLFSAAWCPHCKTVRKLLEKQGVRFTELDVERNERAAAFQREMMPVAGFPVTVIGSKIVMGSDEGQILAALQSL
jgi:glutaredoxin